MLTIFGAAAVASDVNLVALEWAGPYRGDEARIGSVRIADHPMKNFDGVIVPAMEHTAPGSEQHPELRMTAPDPDLVTAGSTAIFDLLFWSVDGATWRLIITRIR